MLVLRQMNAVPLLLAIALQAIVLHAGCARNVPMPDVPIRTDDNAIAHGRYLATSAMACVSCHSPRDWQLWGGPPKAGFEFAGNPTTSMDEGFPPSFHFGAPNLTPTHLSTWSDGEIARATVLGQSKNGDGLFPIMPYRVWRDSIAADDVADVVAFLRTLPPLPSAAAPGGRDFPEGAAGGRDFPEGAPGGRKFPMPSFVLNRIPEARTLRARAPQPMDADYGEYVTLRAGCLECHTDADNRGNFTGPRFAGGRAFAVPAPGAGTVRSANLTPDAETGLTLPTAEAFVARFKSPSPDAAQPVARGGMNTVMPWAAYAGMTEEDLTAMYGFLRSLPPHKNAVVRYTPKP